MYMIEKQEKKRTIQQNKAIHVLFDSISKALNEAGLDVVATLEHGVDISWSPSMVKELLWKGIQKIQVGKASTTELNTKEIDLIFDTLNRYLALKGLHVDFPSIETVMNEIEAGKL